MQEISAEISDMTINSACFLCRKHADFHADFSARKTLAFHIKFRRVNRAIEDFSLEQSTQHLAIAKGILYIIK